MLTGLMSDDFQLSLTTVVERAEQLSPMRTVVSRRPDGTLDRTTMGACARRARRLAGGLAGLGIGDGDRVATLLWNQSEHLELYFAVPLMGAVIHTLNPRLHPDEISYIAADAEDRVLVVDESLRDVVDSIDWEFEHVIVVSRSARQGQVAASGSTARPAAGSTTTRYSPPRRRSGGRRSASAEPRRCVTRRAPPGVPRESCTRIGRSSFTPSQRRFRTSTASARAT